MICISKNVQKTEKKRSFGSHKIWEYEMISSNYQWETFYKTFAFSNFRQIWSQGLKMNNSEI